MPIQAADLQSHVITHIFSQCFAAPAPTFRLQHLHISASRHPILLKLRCYRCPNHLNLPCLARSATLRIPRRLHTFTALSITQGHSTNPSHIYRIELAQELDSVVPFCFRRNAFDGQPLRKLELITSIRSFIHEALQGTYRQMRIRRNNFNFYKKYNHLWAG